MLVKGAGLTKILNDLWLKPRYEDDMAINAPFLLTEHLVGVGKSYLSEITCRPCEVQDKSGLKSERVVLKP